MHLVRFSCRKVPGLRDLDIDFPPQPLVVLYGCHDSSLRLLRAVADAARDMPPDRGSSLLQVRRPAKARYVASRLPPSEVAELHRTWAQHLRSCSGPAKRLRSAWDDLWGSRRLDVAGPRSSILAFPWDCHRSAPLAVKVLENQGSGYVAAFNMLAQAALPRPPGLVFVEDPDACLHVLVALRVPATLQRLLPSSQVVMTVRSEYVLSRLNPGVVIDTSGMMSGC